MTAEKATDTFNESIFVLIGTFTTSLDKPMMLFEIPLSSDPSIRPTDFLKLVS